MSCFFSGVPHPHLLGVSSSEHYLLELTWSIEQGDPSNFARVFSFGYYAPKIMPALSHSLASKAVCLLCARVTLQRIGHGFRPSGRPRDPDVMKKC